MQVDPADDTPQEEIIEDDDLDLDLSDLHSEPASSETVRERLQRAAKRRTTKQQEKNWHDTPVNVTPSGRHEILEDDEIIEEDMSVDDVVITPSGRHEVVEIVDGAQLRMHGVVTALVAADGPRRPDVVGHRRH